MDTGQLEREIRVFSRYLARVEPGPYIVRKYIECQHADPTSADMFDGFLLWLASRSAVAAAIADSYACLLRKNSLLRKKLVVALALLECAAPASDYLDGVDFTPAAMIWPKLAWTAGQHVLALLTSLVLVLPAHLWCATRERL